MSSTFFKALIQLFTFMFSKTAEDTHISSISMVISVNISYVASNMSKTDFQHRKAFTINKPASFVISVLPV